MKHKPAQADLIIHALIIEKCQPKRRMHKKQRPFCGTRHALNHRLLTLCVSQRGMPTTFDTCSKVSRLSFHIGHFVITHKLAKAPVKKP